MVSLCDNCGSYLVMLSLCEYTNYKLMAQLCDYYDMYVLIARVIADVIVV